MDPSNSGTENLARSGLRGDPREDLAQSDTLYAAVIPSRVAVVLVGGSWLAVLALGVLVRLLTSSIGGEPASLWGTLRRQLHFVAPWILLTPAVGWVGLRRPFSGGRWKIALPLHLGGLTGVVLLHAVLNALSYPLFYPEAPMPDIGRRVFIQLASGAPISVLFYATVVAAANGLEFLLRAKHREVLTPRLEARLADAQMAALRTRLQPDLLIAAVEAAADLVGRDLKRARNLLVRLGDLLRANLETSRRAYVSLGEELELVRLFLELRRESGAGREVLRVDVPDALVSARIPGFVLRSLLGRLLSDEAAFSPPMSEVRVLCGRAGGDLEIEVVVRPHTVAGHGRSSGSTRRASSDLIEGLREIFPESVEFTFAGWDGDAPTYVLRMPLELPPEEITD